MTIRSILHAAAVLNFASVRIAWRNPKGLRGFLSISIQNYREAAGDGLKGGSPFALMEREKWTNRATRFELPLRLNDDSGTRWDEQMCLAAVTRQLQPKTVFEMGTYNGRTTSIFVLNTEPDTKIYTLDLPPDTMRDGLCQSDQDLIKRRRIGAILGELGLKGRYQQLFCDSLQFDPSPYAASVELGFVDGGHSLECVRNDTEKMAVMAADRGLVFWHDYGGLGEFAGLTRYLEELATRIPVYKVAGTTLAWAAMRDLATLRKRSPAS